MTLHEEYVLIMTAPFVTNTNHTLADGTACMQYVRLNKKIVRRRKKEKEKKNAIYSCCYSAVAVCLSIGQ